MAKKKNYSLIESNNELIKELAEVEWLKQPWVYTLICGDFSPMQTNLLLQLTKSLQERINDYLSKKSSGINEGQLSLFTEEETVTGAKDFEIELSSLGIRADNYDDFEKACAMMSRMNISYSIVDEKNNLKKVYTSPFSRIEIPKLTDKKYNYKGNAGKEGRRAGIVTVTMLSKNIRDLFSMKMGYVNFISNISTIAHRKHTPRLYIYLQRWKNNGSKSVSYMELKEYLGVIEYNSKGDMKDKYPKFSVFCLNVLDKVKEDMEELAKNGLIDIYFDYRPIYKNGKKRGNPQDILFEIMQSGMGKKKSLNIATFKEGMDIQDYLNAEFNIARMDSTDLMKKVTNEMMAGFKSEVYMLSEKIEKYKPQNIKGYALTILRRYIETHAPMVEEIKEPNKVQNTPTLEDKKSKAPVVPQKDLEQWNLFIEKIKMEVSVTEYDTWFSSLSLSSVKRVEEGVYVTIQVPTLFVAEYLEDKYPVCIKKALTDSFGGNILLQYKLLS